MDKEARTNPKENMYADRLSKRMCYILRYGAVKEGLTIFAGG